MKSKQVNVWQTLPRPIIVLAPMADVTDSAFRQVIAAQGRPDLFFTEFVSADGLASANGRPKLLRDFYFTEIEKPIIAQIFGSRPENIELAASLASKLGFGGVDINMGCPDRAVERQGAGAALIKNPGLAQEIIAAAKAGAGGLPVSVKTRIGYNRPEIEDWTATLLAARPAAITFHLRTRKEMSQVPANWEAIRVPVALSRGSGVLILGNGDVRSVADAKEKAALFGVDGVMLGRAIFGNPFLFSGHQPSAAEKLIALKKHSKLFWELYGPTETNLRLFGGHGKNFAVMKKHFKAYVSDFDGAAALRAKLMLVNDAAQVEKIVSDFLSPPYPKPP